MNRKTVQTAKELCRDLRRRSTRGEEIFWDAVRNRKIDGKKFLRQHPIFFSYTNTDTFFIADFYCHEKKLVIEIDGKSHNYQKEYDELRTHIINALAIDVIRFRNEDIEKNISKVIENLQVVLKGSHPCAKGASATKHGGQVRLWRKITLLTGEGVNTPSLRKRRGRGMSSVQAGHRRHSIQEQPVPRSSGQLRNWKRN